MRRVTENTTGKGGGGTKVAAFKFVVRVGLPECIRSKQYLTQVRKGAG